VRQSFSDVMSGLEAIPPRSRDVTYEKIGFPAQRPLHRQFAIIERSGNVAVHIHNPSERVSDHLLVVDNEHNSTSRQRRLTYLALVHCLTLLLTGMALPITPSRCKLQILGLLV
jgi:hypothetical protein